jgi:hypothetical protein
MRSPPRVDEITEAGRSKAAFVADLLNKTLYTLVTSCSKSDGVRNYFDVGVITYAGSQVTSGFDGALSGDISERGLVQPAEGPVGDTTVQQGAQASVGLLAWIRRWIW